ncbi:hypothetical protein H4219_005738 [Mycoemilia scoparia]|uniref:ABC transporter domain-containing protein n=1 Tax=Mycoemilia scoparia TaxID=417184 RepID=A0A9W8DJ93_9FUNG|nr:hypothetical protein H4219_005738 [Mycoemilia scoparia]
MLTPPFPPTLPSCLDKSSPDYVVEHASPLSRFFTLWFYGFATGIMKNKDLTPSDFPTEAVDENSENYAKQAYVVYPLMLSNKAWFLWSMLRPFKWKLTKRLVIGIFQSVLTLASSMTIHWLLKRIEEERDLRVIIPESLWLILGIFLRSIISIALDKLEASEAKSLKKQIAIGLSEVLKEIAINQKEFSVSPPLHYQLDDRSKSYSATGGFWGALEWIKKTFFSFRDIKNEDEIAEKLESSKELLKTYTTRVHIKEIGYSATQMCEIIDNQSADPKHDSLEIRDDAYFVWNIPTVSPDDWIVDDRNYTVMVPEPYTKDTNLKKFNTDSIKHFANNVVLKAINTKIPLGKVTIITGPTGSGKTSLAKALMGEMCCISGQVHFPCYTNNGWPAHGGGYRRWEVGYVSQKPWLQNATFRDNILFGTEFDANRYKRVIYACALDKDLESFPDCDLTLVGEGGVVLSGGQKHRLAMARALYSQAPILIFDDCLSGVDPETAEHLLTHCISPSCELTSGRTVVVVSNQVSMCVAVADNVIVMSEGRIRAQGIWSELISKGVLAGGGQPDPEQQCQAKDYVIPESALQFRIASRDQKQKDVNHSINDSLKSEKSIKVFNILTITRSYMVHLQREIGPTIVNAEPVYFDVTPKEEISTAFSKRSESLAESLVDSVEGIIEIFTWGTLTSICLLKNYPALAIPLFLTGGCFYLVHKLTSQFSSHTDDMEVKHNVNTASYANELDNGIFTIRAFGLECQLLKNYENRSNSFCRLHDCVALSAEWKSSVYSLVNPIMNFSLTTLFLLYALSNGSGLSIVQLLRIDRAQHSLSLRSNGLVLNHAIDTGLMGIMLTKIIVLKQVVESILKLSIKVDLMAKNIRKYFNCLSLPQEGVPHMPNSKVSPEWPEKGEIVFQDFSTSYQRSVQWLLNLSGDTNGSKIDVDEKQNDSRLALDHISFKIKGGERIGIVGRTGAGKSTLSLSLFNFLKAKSGSIEIDGVDISKIGLEDLRSKISIITQDPSVFRGDLGFNVDPFNTHSREHIINILDALELCDRPKDKETGGTDDNKDSIIETGSSSTANPKSSRPFRSLEDIVYESLNKGHQQLISLARALARQSRILVLDEPTASLDYEIDQKIQKVIRGDLTKGATILCIAHRLKTVIDYDRIMVISKGNVAEFDTPANLINDPNTLFHKMCKATKDFDSLAKAANRNNGMEHYLTRILTRSSSSDEESRIEYNDHSNYNIHAYALTNASVQCSICSTTPEVVDTYFGLSGVKRQKPQTNTPFTDNGEMFNALNKIFYFCATILNKVDFGNTTEMLCLRSSNPNRHLEIKTIQYQNFDADEVSCLEISEYKAHIFRFANSTLVYKDRNVHRYGLSNGFVVNAVTFKETGKILPDIELTGDVEEKPVSLDEDFEISNTEALNFDKGSASRASEKLCFICTCDVKETQNYVQLSKEYACATSYHLACIYSRYVSLAQYFIFGKKTNYLSELDNIGKIIGAIEVEMEVSRELNIGLEIEQLSSIKFDDDTPN